MLHLALMLSTYLCHVCPPCLPIRLSAFPSARAIGHSQARPADSVPVPLVARQALLAKQSPLAGGHGRHAVEHGRKPRRCSAAVLQCYCYCKSISVWQAGWQAGRRNETGRDPLDAAIFSPRPSCTYPSVPYLRPLLHRRTLGPWGAHDRTQDASMLHAGPGSVAVIHSTTLEPALRSLSLCFLTPSSSRPILRHSRLPSITSAVPSGRIAPLRLGSFGKAKVVRFSFSTTPTDDPV